MKNFLTNTEACTILKRIIDSNILTEEDSISLASIRVCLAAEEQNLNLWGTSVENARPFFRKPEIPNENSSTEIKENYEAYKMCLTERYQKLNEQNKGA